MRRPPRRRLKNEDVFPDVRDGLTRPERVVLSVLAQAQAERGGRNVPVAELYGRVVEVLDMSQEELVDILRRLGAGTPAAWRDKARES